MGIKILQQPSPILSLALPHSPQQKPEQICGGRRQGQQGSRNQRANLSLPFYRTDRPVWSHTSLGPRSGTPLAHGVRIHLPIPLTPWSLDFPISKMGSQLPRTQRVAAEIQAGDAAAWPRVRGRLLRWVTGGVLDPRDTRTNHTKCLSSRSLHSGWGSGGGHSWPGRSGKAPLLGYFAFPA